MTLDISKNNISLALSRLICNSSQFLEQMSHCPSTVPVLYPSSSCRSGLPCAVQPLYYLFGTFDVVTIHGYSYHKELSSSEDEFTKIKDIPQIMTVL